MNWLRFSATKICNSPPPSSRLTNRLQPPAERRMWELLPSPGDQRHQIPPLHEIKPRTGQSVIRPRCSEIGEVELQSGPSDHILLARILREGSRRQGQQCPGDQRCTSGDRRLQRYSCRLESFLCHALVQTRSAEWTSSRKIRSQVHSIPVAEQCESGHNACGGI